MIKSLAQPRRCRPTLRRSRLPNSKSEPTRGIPRLGSRRWFLAGLTILLGSLLSPAAATDSANGRVKPIPVAELNRSAVVDFDREILPLLRNSCLACHNRTTAKARLILETPADILKGGDSGPALEPGRGASSLLLQAAAHQLEDTIMPPPGNKAKASDFSPQDLALLRLWIDQGAMTSSSPRQDLQWQPLPKGWKAIHAVAITRDGQFAACGRANRVYLYHLPTGRIADQPADPMLTIDSSLRAAHHDVVQSLDFNPDGTLLASGAYREIKLWKRPVNPERLRIDAGGPVTSLAASADGTWLAAGDSQGRIRLWSTSTGTFAKELSRHRGPVTGLAFAPDGLFLCSGSTDKTLRIWSVTNGQLIARTNVSTQVAAVNWLATGAGIASACADSLIHLWDFDRIHRRLVGRGSLHGHEGPVTALAITTQDSNQLLSGSSDGTIRLWNLHARSPLRILKHGGPVTAVAIRPDGRRLASAGVDRVTRLWDPGDGRLVAELKSEKQSQDRLAERERENVFLKDEVAFQVAAHRSAETNQIAQVERVQKALESEATAARDLSRTQKQLADAREAKTSAEKAVAAIKVELDQAPVERPPDAKGGETSKGTRTDSTSNPVSETEADPRGKDLKERERTASEKLRTASRELAEAETGFKKAGQQLSNTQTELQLAQRAQNDAGTTVNRALAESEQAGQALRNSESDLKQARLSAAQHHLPVRAVTFSPDNSIVATAGDDRLVRSWSTDNGTPLATFRGHVDSVTAALFTPDGTLISAASDQRIEFWEPGASWTLARKLGTGGQDSPLADRVNALRFSPDGTRLAAGGGEPTRGGEVTLWNPDTGRLLRAFTNVHSDSVLALDVNRDGTLLATASADRFAKVLDLETGAIVRPLEGHTHHVLGVAWKRDGRTLATAGADNLVRIWELPGGERRKSVPGFDKEVTSITFVGYTDQALATSGDGKVRLLKQDGSEVRSFQGASDFVHAAAATPDGKLVIAGGQDGVLRVWNGIDGRLITSFAPPESD